LAAAFYVAVVDGYVVVGEKKTITLKEAQIEIQLMFEEFEKLGARQGPMTSHTRSFSLCRMRWTTLVGLEVDRAEGPSMLDRVLT
jgi:hypothetical protein